MSRALALILLCLVPTRPDASAAAEALRDRPHCQRGLFCLAGERRGDEVLLWLEVETDQTLILAVQLETEGLDGPGGPLHLLLDAPVRLELARWRILGSDPWRLDWRYTFHPGSSPARHAPEAPYRLPYPPGEAYRVLQGPGGSFSHQGPLANAIDWAMPVGSEVRAARAGRVLGLRDEAGPGGPDPALQGQENYLWIRHADGTVGQYLHLQQGSLLVGQGERVDAGQPIARSGDSGYSSEPHLHFHVSTPTTGGDVAFESFPLRFDLGDDRSGPLKTGRTYRAPAD